TKTMLQRDISPHETAPEQSNVDFAHVPVNVGRGGREFHATGARPAARLTVSGRAGGGWVRVLVVDDHPIVASGCRALLESDPAIKVLDAADANAGYAAYFAHQPDVALIDLNLPGLSGLELCRRILQRAPDARIIIFSMNDDPVFAARA